MKLFWCFTQFGSSSPYLKFDYMIDYTAILIMQYYFVLLLSMVLYFHINYLQVYGKKKYKKKQIEQEIKWNHNTRNVPTLLLGLDLETDVQFPLVVPSRTNKQI